MTPRRRLGKLTPAEIDRWKVKTHLPAEAALPQKLSDEAVDALAKAERPARGRRVPR